MCVFCYSNILTLVGICHFGVSLINLLWPGAFLCVQEALPFTMWPKTNSTLRKSKKKWKIFEHHIADHQDSTYTLCKEEASFPSGQFVANSWVWFFEAHGIWSDHIAHSKWSLSGIARIPFAACGALALFLQPATTGGWKRRLFEYHTAKLAYSYANELVLRCLWLVIALTPRRIRTFEL